MRGRRDRRGARALNAMGEAIAALVLASAVGAASLLAGGGAVRNQTPQTPAFRAGVDVVELNVSVTDGRRVVANLTAADFTVIDNGVRQPVISAVRESVPIDVTLLIDVSGSVTPTLEKMILSAVNRIRGRLRGDDRVSLVTFNHRVREHIALALPPLVKGVELPRPSGQTSLYDGIGVVLAQPAAVDRRQMMIVFTDGYDSSSFLDADDVVAIGARSGTAVFAISRAGFGPGAPGGVQISQALPLSTPASPSAFFDRISAATGGFAQVVPAFNVTRTTGLTGGDATRITQNTNLLDDYFLRAFDEFRASYLVRYNLTGVTREGWHAVSVTINRPGRSYTVRTRTGYAF